ncbi:hypothetical protein RHGRI_024657 [Rhododendron griersonianum]|uniref:Uncharacterized protein n=1 Tax=Rhododendron griersonianum TaxID=479676 RepID=A0AAV6J889_9ERIC|nr:hypothetical protein RHGRI_024657 [Rhododendron griersonianum]
MVSTHTNEHLAALLSFFCNDLKAKEPESERKWKKGPRKEDKAAEAKELQTERKRKKDQEKKTKLRLEQQSTFLTFSSVYLGNIITSTKKNGHMNRSACLDDVEVKKLFSSYHVMEHQLLLDGGFSIALAAMNANSFGCHEGNQ